jgi:uncharacterized protein YdhG (YjbR/CyaY superfamily)
MTKIKPTNVDEYIDAAPANAQERLNEIRSILRMVAPNATEILKWGKPVFMENRIFFSYSAYRSHLIFMPTGPALEPFKEELTKFTTGKDTIQFPYDKPLPKDLIHKIASYRVKDVRDNDAKWMY